MLGPDLASLYSVTTSELNQAVRRNIDRFPGDFMFALTREEAENLRSQSVISSWGGSRRLPFAFTGHGASMLSAILRSDHAVQVSIAIIRSFMRMRELVAANKDIAVRAGKLERGHERVASVIEILGGGHRSSRERSAQDEGSPIAAKTEDRLQRVILRAGIKSTQYLRSSSLDTSSLPA